MKAFPDLTGSDVERILGVVDRLNDIEVFLEVDGMKLHVRKFSNSSLAPATAPAEPAAPAWLAAAASTPAGAATEAPVSPVSTATPAAAPPAPASRDGLLEVRAPMLGRFFRASSPSDSPYVEVGARVEPDDTVCMMEVMKLFNTVKAGVSGVIEEILVENGAMVEHDAVLFRVRPQ